MTAEERTGYRSGDRSFTPPVPERANHPLEPPAGPTCERCGGPMLERHCKLLCTTCGYQRDCSDP